MLDGSKCYRCGSENTKVIDIRYKKKIGMKVRTRECLNCGWRSRTIELHIWELQRLTHKKA